MFKHHSWVPWWGSKNSLFKALFRASELHVGWPKISSTCEHKLWMLGFRQPLSTILQCFDEDPSSEIAFARFSKTISTCSYHVLGGRTEYFINVQVWVLCFAQISPTIMNHPSRYFLWSCNFISAPALTVIYKLCALIFTFSYYTRVSHFCNISTVLWSNGGGRHLILGRQTIRVCAYARTC